MTSHDVVAVVRRVLGERKVGHTGTLDPGVAGVLPICVGKATRLAEFIAGADKAYRAEITFGVTTDTQDSFGSVTGEVAAGHLTRGDLAYVLPRFQGEILQVPPMVSAVKVDGIRLYELARAGIEVHRDARPVQIMGLRLLDFRPGPRPVAWLDVVCSKGTYIRTLAAGIGAALAVGAHMSYLVRTRTGSFGLAQSDTLQDLEAGRATMLTPSAALGDMPRTVIEGEAARRLRYGVAPVGTAGLPDGGPSALLDPAGNLLALVEVSGGSLKLLKVFA